MTPTVEFLGTTSPIWSEMLGQTRHDFYHLPSFADLCAAHERGEAKAMYVEIGRSRLLLPLVVRPIPGSDRTDATSPYGYPGPLVQGTDDAAFLATALRAGIGALRAAGVVSLFVRLHPLLNGDPPEGTGEIVHHGDTVSIDLTQPREELLGQMRHNHRRDIRKAMADGLEARPDPSFTHLDRFVDLYRETMERRSASPFYCFTDEYFDRLRAALGHRLHLLLVEHGGAIAAAGLFVETAGIVEYHLAAVADDAVRSGACKLLVHFASLWAKERGDQRLHLGGGVGGANDSLFYYKSGFSPLSHAFRTMRVVVDEREYARLVRHRDQAGDPGRLDGYFPAYRAA